MSKEVTIPVPSNLKIVKRCEHCLIENHLCALLNGSEICLHPLLDKDGNFEGFDVVPCKFNKTGKIKIEG